MVRATTTQVDKQCDGDTVVSLRPSTLADRGILIAGRDAESRRYLGEGSPDPAPAFCILAAGEIVGWVDFDVDRSWLLVGEVNIGYNVFPEHRRLGYAARAVQLLFEHLGTNTEYTVATLLIDVHNTASLGVAGRLMCERQPDMDSNAYFKTPLVK